MARNAQGIQVADQLFAYALPIREVEPDTKHNRMWRCLAAVAGIGQDESGKQVVAVTHIIFITNETQSLISHATGMESDEDYNETPMHSANEKAKVFSQTDLVLRRNDSPTQPALRTFADLSVSELFKTVKEEEKDTADKKRVFIALPKLETCRSRGAGRT